MPVFGSVASGSVDAGSVMSGSARASGSTTVNPVPPSAAPSTVTLPFRQPPHQCESQAAPAVGREFLRRPALREDQCALRGRNPRAAVMDPRHHRAALGVEAHLGPGAVRSGCRVQHVVHEIADDGDQPARVQGRSGSRVPGATRRATPRSAVTVTRCRPGARPATGHKPSRWPARPSPDGRRRPR